MPKKPTKKYLFCIIAAFLFFLSGTTFCAQKKLTEYQERARAYRQEGLQLQAKGDVIGAMTLYQKAIILDSTYVVAYNDAGVIYEAWGNMEQARQLYIKAIEMDPEFPNSYSNLALLYESEGDYASALPNWAKRLALGGSDDPWTVVARKRHNEIIHEFMKIGLKAAEQDMELFSKKENDSGESFNEKIGASDYLRRAKEHFSKGDYVAALKEATLAEYLDSSNSEISAFVQKIRKTLLQ